VKAAPFKAGEGWVENIKHQLKIFNGRHEGEAKRLGLLHEMEEYRCALGAQRRSRD
jgi:hypothetical protein